ncbi:MAG: T9SS type A sorting domain-containing protein [Bacteroidetes bacterium]|nr:T9SS type A sorting domain-containing protein [Bacteroidota bacterium]
MKNIIFCLFILIALKSNSTDWDLFPLEQRSYFSYPHFSGRTGVELYIMDSVVLNGQNKASYSRKKIPNANYGQCNIDSIRATIWTGITPDNKLIDSLGTIGDTTFYYSAESTLPFYFFTNAQVGQSWTITSDYWANDYNEIAITCDSIYQTSFLGITDSVKSFSMVPNGMSANQVPISNFRMILSKNYGIIEMVPFAMFLEHHPSIDFFSMQIVGLDNGAIQRGYSQPLFADYFKLSAGDILFWHYHRYPSNIQQPRIEENYRDTITAADFYADSVVYTYDRVIEHEDLSLSFQYGNHKYFRRADLELIVESAPDWFTFGTDHNLDSYISSYNPTYYWSTLEMLVGADSITGDTITTIRAITADNALDTVSCALGMTADIFREIIFNNKEGIISYCDYAWGDDCLELVGSRINGIQNGNISLDVDDMQISSLNELIIYPSPVSNIIKVSSRFNLINSDLEIYNCVGKLMKKSKLILPEISVSDLSAGIYFVKLNSTQGSYAGKFIKE